MKMFPAILELEGKAEICWSEFGMSNVTKPRLLRMLKRPNSTCFFLSGVFREVVKMVSLRAVCILMHPCLFLKFIAFTFLNSLFVN